LFVGQNDQMKRWILPILFTIALAVGMLYWMGEISFESHDHHEHAEGEFEEVDENYLNNIPDSDLTEHDREEIRKLQGEKPE
jgi:hypothetical protein